MECYAKVRLPEIHLEDNALKMSGFVENFDNEEIIRVIYKDEILFEGKAGALAVLLSHEIKKGSGKVLENGVTQIEMGVL